jgi:hypothetical protein
MEDPYENGTLYTQLCAVFRQFGLKSLGICPTEQNNPYFSFSEREKAPISGVATEWRSSFSTGTHGLKSSHYVIEPSNATCIGYRIHLEMSTIFWESNELYPSNIWDGDNRRVGVMFHDLPVQSLRSWSPRRLLSATSTLVIGPGPGEPGIANSHALLAGAWTLLDSFRKTPKSSWVPMRDAWQL